jgi:hypothetical protein
MHAIKRALHAASPGMTGVEMRCKLCESATEHFGEQKILGEFDARYRRCTACGFVCVENPVWLEQAYSSAIAASDTGIVARNLRLADATSLLIRFAFNHAQRFLDFGGGAGLFVRLMRDRGFDFRLLDKYCENIFAAGFEAQPGERFDVVTCMEVAEHLVDPLPTFLELASLAPTIVVSTHLLPDRGNRPGEWWYYAPETGQHVSFYTVRALHVIAERLHMHLATNRANLHLLSHVQVSNQLLRLVGSPRGRAVAAVVARLFSRRRKSLIDSDAKKLRPAPTMQSREK